MKKIIRTNNLQKALEDYDALKGQAVSYVSVLPLPPNVRNGVYCKQSTTNIEESMVLTVDRLIENYAQETETANHFVIPETYTITYSNDVVKGIEVSGDVAIMYEDEDFTTALATTFNLEDNYIFDVITHVTEMAYYMGDAVNQVLHPVVSFGVIAEVHSKIDRVERELDAKIDSNYNTLDNKIDNSYNTLDSKIDNEISNLAVNFTTDNLVANVATVTNASVSSLNVAEIIANGSAGTNGQIIGKVNGNLEWQDFSTDNFVVNNITVNKNAVADNASVNNLAVANIIANESATDNATINNLVVNNATLPRTVTKEVSYLYRNGQPVENPRLIDELNWETGFGDAGITNVTYNLQFLPFITMLESEYNNSFIGKGNKAWSGYGYSAYQNIISDPVLAFVATAPLGNIYFAGKKIIEMNLIPNVDGIEITPNSSTFTNSVVTPTLTFTTDPVTNNLSNVGVNVKVSSVFGSSYHSKAQANLPYGINDNGSDITTNINNTQFTSFDELFYNKQSMTDCFITNPSLILNAPSGYNVWSNVSSMVNTFRNCKVFNQPITIPEGVTNMSGTFCSCMNFNQLVTIPNSVTNMSGTFGGCMNFNQPITIPEGVTDISSLLFDSKTGRSCRNFNQPVIIPNSVTNMVGTFSGDFYSIFNQPFTIPNGITRVDSILVGQIVYNQPVTFPDSVTSAFRAIGTCTNFNAPVVLGNGLEQAGQLFETCTNFNQPVSLPSSIKTMWGMFTGCTKFNQPVSIPADAINATRMDSMFHNCTKFNQSLNIPVNISNLDNTFNGCTTLASSSVPIHISHEIAKGDTSNYIYNMLVNGGCGITFAASRILNDL